MMKVELLCVGRLKDTFYAQACREYEKRLGGFCHLRIQEIPEYKTPDNPSPAEIERALREEGSRLLAVLPENAMVIALCIEGKALSSPQLAEWLDRTASLGKSNLCFLIGGSFGMDEAVKKRADLRLSMSPMTFPHTLARVMVLEQIYRAFSINRGSRYHK